MKGDVTNFMKLHELSEGYDASLREKPITCLNAGWIYTAGGLVGAHSDFWYEESVHLLMSAVDSSRTEVADQGQ
jgi:hypothetical protein